MHLASLRYLHFQYIAHGASLSAELKRLKLSTKYKMSKIMKTKTHKIKLSSIKDRSYGVEDNMVWQERIKLGCG